MASANTAPIKLPAEWIAALGEVKRRRSKPHYKPAALFVMLDMIEDGTAPNGTLPFSAYNERFRRLLIPFDSKGSQRGSEPFFHLSTGNQVWNLVRNGGARPAQDARQVGPKDQAEILPHLLPFLLMGEGRQAVREAVCQMLAADRTEDSKQLLSSATIPPVYLSEQFTEGQVYTREELIERFRVTDATINTGIFPVKGTRSVWLFVTKDKTKDRTQYRDGLEGEILHWQGQNLGRKDSLILDHQKLGLELLVFYRERKYQHEGAGFRYEGRFRHEGHDENHPRNFVLRRVTSNDANGATAEVVQALDTLAQLSGKTRRGQGFHLSQEARRAIEERAMEVAQEHYRAEGWAVDPTPAKTECYDLRCIRNGVELRVEVKGTTSLGEEIILTRNEVRHAREQYPGVALAIVRKIALAPGAEPRASGGDLRIIEPWGIDAGVLDPLAYSYWVPLDRADAKDNK